jgi:hypothetical protein
MSEIYTIINLEDYAKEMRSSAALSICKDHSENLDDYISIGQMVNLIRENCVGIDDENRPLLDEDANIKIFEETSVWIHSIGLAKLASKNLIECAWDDETNQMIFWAKEQSENTNESKPKRSNKRTKRKDSRD